MKVLQIQTVNFRNLAAQTVTPDGGLNVIAGDNAQGKTNLAESVCLCCLGKSPRTDKDREMIAWNQEKAYVKVTFDKIGGNGVIEITLDRSGRKRIAVDGVPLARTGDLMGHLNCVYFSPDDIKIISQSPSERRRFMDIDLCQTDKNYFYSLLRYNKALAQRNNAIKSAPNLQDAKDSVFAWNSLLAQEGARIVAKRRAFLEKLKEKAALAHTKLTDGQETLEIKYVTQVEGETTSELKECLATLLEENVEKDFMLRRTSVGCQRDDVAIRSNGIDLRSYGSQGQLRTAALSLKLAELAVFKSASGEYPVLILDDVLSELDADRQSRLLNFDPRLQILMTTATDIPQKSKGNYKTFEMKNGVCTEK